MIYNFSNITLYSHKRNYLYKVSTGIAQLAASETLRIEFLINPRYRRLDEHPQSRVIIVHRVALPAPIQVSHILFVSQPVIALNAVQFGG